MAYGAFSIGATTVAASVAFAPGLTVASGGGLRGAAIDAVFVGRADNQRRCLVGGSPWSAGVPGRVS